MKRSVLPVLAVTLLSWSATAHAQSSTVNAAKYAELRQRLVDDFLVIGTGSGMSMPAHIRSEQDSYVRWADATIDLGWYIGVLATEHAMRRDRDSFPGFDGVLGALDTDDELVLAMLALERIDLDADIAFAPECPGMRDLNGFFIRDDVPADFHENFPGMTSTRSDFVDPALTNKEMSQDQVYHLLLGLALVHALVDPALELRGRNVRSMALENAERIIRKMDDDNWIIKNPVCARSVERGQSALAYSAGTARCARWFTNDAYVPETTDVAAGLWELNRNPDSGHFQDPDNLHMAMAIIAVGEGFEDESLAVLATLAERHRWSAYPLVYKVLHEPADWCDYRDPLVADAREMLDELPVGEFPASPAPNPPAVHGFTVSNRFIRSSDEHYTGPPDSAGQLNHGLDYMLLHNVAALAAPELWAGGGEAECARPRPQGDDVGTGADMGSTSQTDSGITTGPDAGGDPDAVAEAGGCGCRHARGTASPVLLLLALLGARRRR